MTAARRLVLATLAGLGVVLVLATPALAAAGGGSAGFHGGGGGGRGAGLYLLFQLLIRLAIIGHGLGLLVIVALVVVYLLATKGMPATRAAWGEHRREGRRARRRTAARTRRVELAAAEAAEEDPAFAPDQVRSAASTLFADTQAAWSAADRSGLRRLLSPTLAAEWERRLDDFAQRGWHNHVEPIEAPRIDYVGLDRGSPAAPARVTVRIEAKLRDYVKDDRGRRIKRAGHPTETVRLREFWTLERIGSSWRLASIEQGAEGEHALGAQIVPTQEADEQGLRDEALLEGAEPVPEGMSLSELASVDYDDDARAAALDLSLVDGRFAPDVIEVSVRRAVDAWARAVDGGQGNLRALAESGAIAGLLHPGDPSQATRLVVRGPSVQRIAICALDPRGTPPTLTVELTLTGRRYIEERATTRVLSGNPNRATRFDERWRFALSDDPDQPWRIAAVLDPIATR